MVLSLVLILLGLVLLSHALDLVCLREDVLLLCIVIGSVALVGGVILHLLVVLIIIFGAGEA